MQRTETDIHHFDGLSSIVEYVSVVACLLCSPTTIFISVAVFGSLGIGIWFTVQGYEWAVTLVLLSMLGCCMLIALECAPDYAWRRDNQLRRRLRLSAVSWTSSSCCERSISRCTTRRHTIGVVLPEVPITIAMEQPTPEPSVSSSSISSRIESNGPIVHVELHRATRTVPALPTARQLSPSS